MAELVVLIRIPDNYRNKAEYVFEFLANSWGLPIRIVETNEQPPHVCYGDDLGAINIPFDSSMYAPESVCKGVRQDGFVFWTINDKPFQPLDLVGSIFRLLTFLDEQQIPDSCRNGRGIFQTEKLPESRRELVGLPIVDSESAYLLSLILNKFPDLEQATVPRWPEDCKYAMAVTHDADALHVGHPMEICTNFLKFLIRRDTVYLDMFWNGLSYLVESTEKNPFYGIPKWVEYEEGSQIKSCFYLSTGLHGVSRDLNDVKSSLSSCSINWDYLRDLVDAGWEIGLHPSVNARNSLDALVEGKYFLESRLRRPVRGLRHHYWALDWKNPHKALRKHVNAGFRYDTSIAWSGTPGFRAATSLPFRPFDLDWNKPLDIYEIPTCLTDDFVLDPPSTLPEALQDSRQIIDTVARYHGVAVLDWHQETACDSMCYQNFFSAFKMLLVKYVQDRGCWIATPWEIVKHWHYRSKELFRRQEEL
jgi:hypothetical protein